MKLLRERVNTEPDPPAATESPAIERLNSAKAWIFDMDGVLYRGNAPLPGAIDLFATLQLRSIPFRLATNNSTLTPEQYVKKLRKMDLDVPVEWIVTSGVATRQYLLHRFPKGSPIYVVGEQALFDQLFQSDDLVQANGTDLQATAVVAGLDRSFTYDKLSEAHRQIQNGAAFVATNSDVTLPTEHGLEPGCGSLIAAIQASTGVVPAFVGKPETLMFDEICRSLNVLPSDVVSVGDRLDTDIVAGSRSGTLALLVLTGVSTRADIAHAEARPDLVFTDLNAVLAAIQSPVS
ncbi:MAG: HAD-IIA family hydrolase [Thermomicrobiales bacterium]|nr:HAD-IIA family hydrolase [Thermomicrobiales bacterium]MCO5221139.1 HAD-IIA family hydrolase [Thermomicrobiales bacterium]